MPPDLLDPDTPPVLLEPEERQIEAGCGEVAGDGTGEGTGLRLGTSLWPTLRLFLVGDGGSD